MLLSACAGSECACRATGEGDFVAQRGDPSDAALVDSMQGLVTRAGMPPSSRFQYTRVDLDGDGRRDALVLMTAPYGTWCDLYGCTLYVMKAGAKDFTQVSQIHPVRTPLLVGDRRSNGWRDLVLRIDGRWSQTHDVALKFDGQAYPAVPEEQAPLTEYEMAAMSGQKVFP